MDNIVIIDYGAGNIQSVENALKYFDIKYKVTNNKEDISNSSGIILPGVGAFGSAMEKINNLDLLKCLTDEVIKKKKPFLGICLGFQLLFETSDESLGVKGFGWLNGSVKAITCTNKLPHVGWNNLESINAASELFQNIVSTVDFYFDHSFHVVCDDKYITSKVEIIKDSFSVASVECDNIFAVQFHPEKSQQYGLNVVKNFINIIEKNIKC
jgi:imidazole glycerol-phosphate synthase subunit HisH